MGDIDEDAPIISEFDENEDRYVEERMMSERMMSTVTSSEGAAPLYFGGWLRQTHRLQTASFGYDFPMVGEELATYFTWNIAAIVAELGELMIECRGWKPWITPENRGVHDREAMIKETVDILHFVGNILVGIGCTDNELNRAYAAKQALNAKRQVDGYTGEKDADGRQLD
jgi:dUTPase